MGVPRRIGVLGGMGPEATILFQRKLLEAVPARDDADHIPLLVDMNPQVPSRIARLVHGTGDDPGPVLAAMARRMQDAGAAALVMPCNTAHHYAPAITDAVDIPFLNMVELAADHAAQAFGGAGRVGLLASPAVQRTQLFDMALERRGLTAVWPDAMDTMLAAIRAIKTASAGEMASKTLQDASAELAARGADMQFLACSEFSIIAGCVSADMRVVDTLDLLVQATVAFSQAQ